MRNLSLLEVFDFARIAHQGQKRKYTGDDYIVHPLSVARIVEMNEGTLEMQAAALLHDVVEDTVYTLADINALFGHDIATLVQWLTDTSTPEDGNRATRKAIDRKRLADAPSEAQIIKLADMIDNSDSIIEYDKSFAKVFISEMELLLEVMDKVANTSLMKTAKGIVKNAKT